MWKICIKRTQTDRYKGGQAITSRWDENLILALLLLNIHLSVHLKQQKKKNERPTLPPFLRTKTLALIACTSWCQKTQNPMNRASFRIELVVWPEQLFVAMVFIIQESWSVLKFETVSISYRSRVRECATLLISERRKSASIAATPHKGGESASWNVWSQEND